MIGAFCSFFEIITEYMSQFHKKRLYFATFAGRFKAASQNGLSKQQLMFNI